MYITSYYRERFPFYKTKDGWRTQIKRILSRTPHFKKGNKVPFTGCHLWTLASTAEGLVRIYKIQSLLSTYVFEMLHAGLLK
jgi:hypothetical protein